MMASSHVYVRFSAEFGVTGIGRLLDTLVLWLSLGVVVLKYHV